MDKAAPVLLVGSTGFLGGEIASLLSRAGRKVRALVRETANPDKRAALAALPGTELVSGDLKQPSSLAQACRGVGTVVTTASATGARQEGDSLESVDGEGQLALLEAARLAGVRRVVYVSFPPLAVDCELQRAKRRMEQAIASSGLQYVILQPTYFTEVWFSPALGWDPPNGTVRIFGEGTGRTNWISMYDVARSALAACEDDAEVRLKLELGGPQALSQRDVLGLLTELGMPPVREEALSEVALRTMSTDAGSSLERAFGALMLTVARGQAVDTSKQHELLEGTLRTVRQYVVDTYGKSK